MTWTRICAGATSPPRRRRPAYAACSPCHSRRTPSVGALNLYARYPSAFGVVDRAKATILVSMAGLALSVAHSHEDEERRAANFQAALSSRETIGEAMGILMERERITAAAGVQRLAPGLPTSQRQAPRGGPESDRDG